MNTTATNAVTVQLPDDLIEQIAQRAAEPVTERQQTTATPWLNVTEAADRLRCEKDRIYDLVQQGKLQPRRDGRRVLLHRDDIDAYLESSTS